MPSYEWVRLRIVSDGTAVGTKVWAGDKLVTGVVAASWEISTLGSATVQLKLIDADMDAVGEAMVATRGLTSEDVR